MKKIFIFQFLLVLLYASVVLPQSGKTGIGIFSGVSLNTNSFSIEDDNNLLDTSYSNDNKAAFNLGLFFTYDFTENFSMKIQGQYANKGGITNVSTFYANETTLIERTYTNSLSYLQFSLLPQFNLPFSKKSPGDRAYVNAGGYLSFKLSASESIESQTLLQYQNTDKDISKDISGTDAGLIFSAGIVYKGFLLDVNYELGLSNIVEDPDLKDALSIKNRSINFSIGWTGGL